MYKALETTCTTAKYIYDIKESFDCKIFCNNCICEKIIINLFVLAAYYFFADKTLYGYTRNAYNSTDRCHVAEPPLKGEVSHEV